MAEKTLQTRIALLYKSYEEWSQKAEWVPLKGEVCICEVPASAGAVVDEPAVLIKVGDGENEFQDLPWLSALAADVYAWAKDANLDFDKLDAAFIAKLNAQIDSEGVKGLIQSSEGNARIFNEADGGGAKFEGVNGYASFAGVNSDVKDGIGAQLYDINVAQNKGSKLDVIANGIYYTSGDASALPASARDVADNELVTRKDIKDISGALHYIGKTELADGETIAQAIARLLTEKGHVATSGDIVIIERADGTAEYIYDGEKWEELGDVGNFATKAQLLAEQQAREAGDAAINAALANKTTQKITSSAGVSEVWNETSGGGAHFTQADGSESFVGVNDGTDGLMAQIYADKKIDGKWSGSRINVYNDKIYYTNKAAVDAGVERNDSDHEIVVQKDIEHKVNDFDVLILDCNLSNI